MFPFIAHALRATEHMLGQLIHFLAHATKPMNLQYQQSYFHVIVTGVKEASVVCMIFNSAANNYQLFLKGLK